MKLQSEELEDGIVRIVLTGKLDLAGAHDIDAPFTAAAAGHRGIIVDLAGVSFLASMGLRALVIGAKIAAARGARMAVLAPAPEVEKVLMISGFYAIAPIVHELDAAIAAVHD